MNIYTKVRIAALKRRARSLYRHIHSRSEELSCGANLTDFIRPDIPKMEQEFNQIMVELAKVDPAAKAVIQQEGKLSNTGGVK